MRKSIPSVVWFRNNHEHRNDWIRYGFMKLHKAGKINYSELPMAHCTEYGFSQKVAEYEHRHTSVFLIKENSQKIKCLIDSEDSFIFMNHLIEAVDVYFCSGYNSDFFKSKTFIKPYQWQLPENLEFYQKRITDLIQKYGEHFHKVKKIIPIAPSMSGNSGFGWFARRKMNAAHKIHSLFSDNIYWENDFRHFEKRYQYLMGLRKNDLKYDIVLLDSVWGWPKHRVGLHLKLKELSAKFVIHSKLNWVDPHPDFIGEYAEMKQSDFPLQNGNVRDYETMLSHSRIGVFATGFHWGWRNIVMLSLLIGIPVYTDRILLEPYFDLSEFNLSVNDENGKWAELEKLLVEINAVKWQEIKIHNQKIYDRYLKPEVVAEYVLSNVRPEF